VRLSGWLNGVLVGVLLVLAATAEAQPLGSFTWQLQPHCNRVTVTVTQNGGIYTLDGADDQCGAAQAAPLVGVAAPNPDGTIGFGLNIVSPSGQPIPVQARISISTLSGTWSDNAGNGGAFAFGANAGGSPRPLPGAPGDIAGVTAGTGLTGGGTAGDVTLAVNLGEVQSRVMTACPPGQALRSIAQDGTAVCESISGTAGGDITSVTAGAGLTGGGSSGAVSLAVEFGGSGGQFLAARADHTHTVAGNQSTAVGLAALANNTASFNTALGATALLNTTTGFANTAVGAGTLAANTTGTDNTAVGRVALNVATASGNTAVGSLALGANTTGATNAAVGAESLRLTTTGANNVGVGRGAGRDNVTGSRNTLLGTRADVAAGDLVNAIAIGADALVGRNDSIVLGSVAGVNGAAADVNVGIGTITPFSALSIARNGTADLRFEGFGAVSGGSILGHSSDGTRAAPAPAATARDLLSINGDARGTFNSAGGPPVRIVLASAEGYAAGGRGSRIRFETTPIGSATRNMSMVIDHNGNVGVGTIAPAARLDVVGGLGTEIQLTAASFTPDIVGRRSNGTLATPTAVTAGSALLSLRGDGHTGSGFEESASIVLRANEAWTPTATGSTIEFITAANGTTSRQTRLFIDDDGQVGIGTSIPRATLEVAGTLRVETLGAAGTTALCRNFVNQIATCSSSLRYKRDVEAFDGGLEMLGRLRPISFTWKAGGMRDVGFGAEDVAAIDPRLAVFNQAGEVEGVKYDRLTTVLVNAVKELEALVRTLREEKGELERRLTTIEGHVAERMKK
jgi:Chaperone of endosialidase